MAVQQAPTTGAAHRFRDGSGYTCWRGRYTDAAGLRRVVYGRTEAEAYAKLAEQRAAVAQERPATQRPTPPKRAAGTGSLRQCGPTSWQARYRDAEGVRHELHALTREEAADKLAAHCEAVAAERANPVPSLAEWVSLHQPKAGRPTASESYTAIALRQLADVASDVLALPTLPARLRDDLELTLAAARTALQPAREEATS